MKINNEVEQQEKLFNLVTLEGKTLREAGDLIGLIDAQIQTLSVMFNKHINRLRIYAGDITLEKQKQMHGYEAERMNSKLREDFMDLYKEADDKYYITVMSNV